MAALFRPSLFRATRCARWLLLVVLAGYSPADLWAAPPILLQDGIGQYLLGRSVDILEDPDGRWTIADLVSGPQAQRFTPSRQDVPNFGFTKATYWVRFQVENRASREEPWLLEIGYPMLDLITLYVADSQAAFRVKEAGDLFPFHHREVDYQNLLFVLPISRQTPQTIYLRVKTESSMQLPLTLWSAVSFSEHLAVQQYGLGLYYGVMGVMALYNFFLFLTVRDRSYLHYVLYIMCVGLAQMAISGLAYAYFWPNSPWWENRGMSFLIALGLFTPLQFAQSFLHTREWIPRYHHLLSAAKGATVLIMVLSFVTRYAVSVKLVSLAALLTPLLILIAGALCLNRGYRAARFFLLAWVVFLCGLVLMALRSFGLLPSMFVTEHGIQIGSAMEVVLLSLALADRINLMKKEREHLLQLHLAESQKTAALSDTFRKFVPHEFLQLLQQENIVGVRLGDQVQKTMSVLFADIRSFTTICEGMTPAETFQFVNSYLSVMGPVIREHHGFIDKYIGDAIMALFQQAEDAVDAGLAMLVQLRKYNQDRNQAGLPPIQIGIGINTGALMLGTVGEHGRMEGTVISDAVNLAARMEGLTKRYGASLLITHFTLHGLREARNYSTRIIDRVKVKGKSEPVTVIEVLEQEPVATAKLFKESMACYFSKQFPEALRGFQQCLEKNPADSVARLYVERCEQLLRDGVAAHWDGILTLDQK